MKRREHHGKSALPEYKNWCAMKSRCADPKNSLYGGRGIRVCERWRASFEAFFADMGERPSPGHSLERIDVNGHYEPGNVRWATSEEQARNTRRTRFLTMDGVTLSLYDWAARVALPVGMVSYRLSRGMSVEEALRTPPPEPKPRAPRVPRFYHRRDRYVKKGTMFPRPPESNAEACAIWRERERAKGGASCETLA